MKVKIGGYKIEMEFDSSDESLNKQDIKEALEFIWYASDIDITIEEMDEMWSGAKGKLGYISRGFKVGKFELDGRVFDNGHEYAYVKFDQGQVHVKLDDEGVIVDVWDKAHEEVLGTIGIEYDDLKGPCRREYDEEAKWTCVNDHTGCTWNDGHNGCNAEDWMGNQPLKCDDTFVIENADGDRWSSNGWVGDETYIVCEADERCVTTLPDGGSWVEHKELKGRGM